MELEPGAADPGCQGIAQSPIILPQCRKSRQVNASQNSRVPAGERRDLAERDAVRGRGRRIGETGQGFQMISYRNTEGGTAAFARADRPGWPEFRTVDLEAPRGGRSGMGNRSWLRQLPIGHTQNAPTSKVKNDGVRRRGEPQAGEPAGDPDAERAAEDSAEDRDPALPGRMSTSPFLPGEVVAGVDEHVPGARADDSERDAPEREVDDDPRLRAAPSAGGWRRQSRRRCRSQDRERVHVDREHPFRRAGEAREWIHVELEGAPVVRRARDARRSTNSRVYHKPRQRSAHARDVDARIAMSQARERRG